MYRQPNAPQSVGGVLDSGFQLYRASLSQAYVLAAIAALITAPVNFVQPYIVGATVTPGLFGEVALGAIVMGLLAVVLYAALTARIDAVARGASMSLRESLAVGLRRTPAMFVSSLVAVIVIFVGLCLVIIPGLIFVIWLAFGPSAVVIERLGPFASLSYSRAIVRGHWWRTAALLTIIGIVLMVVYFIFAVAVATLVISDPTAVSGGQVPWYINLLVGPVMSAVIAPLFYALMLAIYYDLRLRHEGGDLAARIAATA
jgi:hypothetical protein